MFYSFNKNLPVRHIFPNIWNSTSINVYRIFIIQYLRIDIYYLFFLISISLPHNRQLYRLTTDRLVDIPSNNACTKEITLINMIIPCVIFNARTQFHFDRCTFSDKSPLHIIPWNKMNFIFKTLNISSLQILVLIFRENSAMKNKAFISNSTMICTKWFSSYGARM